MIIYTNILLICIAILPKINIISVIKNATGIRIEDLLIAIYILLEIVTTIRNRKIKNTSKDFAKILKAFSIYFLCVTISSIYGVINGWVNPLVTLLYLIRKIEYFCMILIGFKYMNKYKNFDKFIKVADLVVIVHFIFSVLQLGGIMGSFNAGEAKETLTQGRVSSTFNGAYEFSAFLLLLLPVYLNKILNLKEHKVKNYILVGMIVFDILISESRSSLLIGAFIILLMILKAKKVTIQKVVQRSFLVLLALIVIIVGISTNNINLERFENLSINSIIEMLKITWEYKSFDNYLATGDWYGYSPYTLTDITNMGIDASLYVRVSHWMQMIDGLIESPIVGLGASISGTAADGNYIRILCESGILGFVMWCNLLICIYKTLKDENNSAKTISKYAFISIVIGAVLIDIFEASKVMMTFWFMLGVTYAYTSIEDVKNESK